MFSQTLERFAHFFALRSAPRLVPQFKLKHVKWTADKNITAEGSALIDEEDEMGVIDGLFPIG